MAAQDTGGVRVGWGCPWAVLRLPLPGAGGKEMVQTPSPRGLLHRSLNAQRPGLPASLPHVHTVQRGPQHPWPETAAVCTPRPPFARLQETS